MSDEKELWLIHSALESAIEDLGKMSRKLKPMIEKYHSPQGGGIDREAKNSLSKALKNIDTAESELGLAFGTVDGDIGELLSKKS